MHKSHAWASVNRFHRARRRHAGPRFGRSDANHGEIVSRLRLFPGLSVFETQDVGGGFPDLVVAFGGHNFMFEIKRPGHEGELTENERDFHARWRGQVAIVTSSDQVLNAVGYPDWEPS